MNNKSAPAIYFGSSSESKCTLTFTGTPERKDFVARPLPLCNYSHRVLQTRGKFLEGARILITEKALTIAHMDK